MLNPGDKVVELAGVVRSAAVVTGAITGAWLVLLAKKSWLASGGGFIVGALLGFFVAQIVARLFYRANGNTVVVKVGPASLPSTITAGLVGGIATALVLMAAVVLLFNAEKQGLSLLGIAVSCGATLGILLACLGSLF